MQLVTFLFVASKAVTVAAAGNSSDPKRSSAAKAR